MSFYAIFGFVQVCSGIGFIKVLIFPAQLINLTIPNAVEI